MSEPQAVESRVLLKRLRDARDKAEFDQFMEERANAADDVSADDSDATGETKPA